MLAGILGRYLRTGVLRRRAENGLTFVQGVAKAGGEIETASRLGGAGLKWFTASVHGSGVGRLHPHEAIGLRTLVETCAVTRLHAKPDRQVLSSGVGVLRQVIQLTLELVQ